jgi:hypothetical protein
VITDSWRSRLSTSKSISETDPATDPLAVAILPPGVRSTLTCGCIWVLNSATP